MTPATWVSLLRLPLAALLWTGTPWLRVGACLGAAASDVADGWMARRWKQVSPLGTIVDPLTDKLFVAVALVCFWHEGQLMPWEVVAFLGRDLALVAFAVARSLWGRWEGFGVQAFVCGKIATSLQFVALAWASMGLHPPGWLIATLALLGVGSFVELLCLHGLKGRSSGARLVE